jgi:predicted transcriptional regulator
MRYGSRAEIISRILEIANADNGAAKRAIIYKAFLSYGQFKEYLAILTERNLLIYDHPEHAFKTTEKRLRFLNFCNQIGDVIKELPPQ